MSPAKRPLLSLKAPIMLTLLAVISLAIASVQLLIELIAEQGKARPAVVSEEFAIRFALRPAHTADRPPADALQDDKHPPQP